MNLNQSLYRHSVWYFVLFSIVVVWAFWPSYYSQVQRQADFHNHTHGIAMSAWILLLIAQAWLIRIRKFSIHRTLGKLSYLVMAILIILTFNMIHSRMQTSGALSKMHLVSMALMVNGTLSLIAIYGLAIYYRKQPLVHARYMICTIFPLFTPLTDRLIYRNFQPMIAYAPTIDGNPIVPFFGFLLADLLVLGLLLWDWKSNARLDVFPKVLIILVLYHISLFTFYKLPIWNSFSNWFLSLPLS